MGISLIHSCASLIRWRGIWLSIFYNSSEHLRVTNYHTLLRPQRKVGVATIHRVHYVARAPVHGRNVCLHGTWMILMAPSLLPLPRVWPTLFSNHATKSSLLTMRHSSPQINVESSCQNPFWPSTLASTTTPTMPSISTFLFLQRSPTLSNIHSGQCTQVSQWSEHKPLSLTDLICVHGSTSSLL